MVKTTESISKFSANNLGYIPMVVEQSGRGERAYDIYSSQGESDFFSWPHR
jgi:hypothetical protein